MARGDSARACSDDPRHGGDARVRRSDHLVGGRKLERLEGQEDRIGSAGAADRMAHRRELGNGRLELLDLRTHDELLTLDDRHDRREDGVTDGGVLGLEIKDSNVHSLTSGVSRKSM